MTSTALLLAALAPALLGGPRPAGDHLALHPEDAAFTLSVPDVQALVDAYGGTAWGALLAEPELQPMLEMLDSLTGDLTGELGLLDLPWMELMGQVQAVSMSGPSLGAAFELFGAMQEGAPPKADVLMLMDAVSEEAAVSLQRAMGQQLGVEAAELDALGASSASWTLSMPGAPPMRCERSGSRLELALGEARSVAEGSRSSASRFGATAGVVVMEARLEPQWEAAAGVGDLLQTLGEGFMGPWFTMASRGGDWRVVLEGDRFVTDGWFPVTPGARALGGQPLGEAPVARLEETSVQVTYSLQAAELERSLGLEGVSELDAAAVRGLLGSLGDRATLSMSNKISVLSAPPLLLTIPVEDEAAARAGLEALMGVLEAQLAGAATVTNKPYRKNPLYTLEAVEGIDLDLDLPLPIDLAGLLKPSFSVAGGALLVSTNASQLKRAIRSQGKEGEGVIAVEDGSGLATEEDWMGVLAAAYDGVLALVGGFMGGMTMGLEEAGMEGEAPQNPLDALPPSDLLRKHFRPASRWRRIEGDLVRYHSESSFGPEFLAVIPMLAVGVMTTSEPAPKEFSLEEGSSIPNAEAGDY
jgi:hypothetical protein